MQIYLHTSIHAYTQKTSWPPFYEKASTKSRLQSQYEDEDRVYF